MPIRVEEANLAQKLSNPTADLITVPIPISDDRDIGPWDNGYGTED